MSPSLKRQNSDTTLFRWRESLKRKKQSELEEKDPKDPEIAQDNHSMENQAPNNLATSKDIEEETRINKTDEQKLEWGKRQS